MLLWTLVYKYLFLPSFLFGVHSEIAGPLGTSIYFFENFFFHSWFTYLYFHHQCTRIQFFYILANSFIFWQYSYPSTCEGVSHCIFICISLVISEVEHIFICFLATCTFFGDLLYRRQGSRPSPWKRNAKKQNAKKAVWWGLTNICEKKRSKKQRRKGKI